MGCFGCLKSSAKKKHKKNPQPLAPRPVQQVQPGTYSYMPAAQQPQSQQYQPYPANGGAPFDPKKAAANAAMAQQAGACKFPPPLPSWIPCSARV
jgi:hypothetical protein